MSVTEWLGTTDGDYQLDANWTNLAPVAGSDVYFKADANPVNINLDNSAVLLDSFHLEVGYTGLLALEDTFLEIQTPLLYIGGNPTGITLTGPLRVNIDVGSVTACDIEVLSSATSAADDSRTPIRLRAVHSDTRLFVKDGLVSFSDDPANSSTIGLLDVTDGDLTVGENVTLTDLNTRAGACLLQSTLSGTLNVIGGTVETALAIAIPTVNVKGGEFISNATGLITTMVITGGTADMAQSNVPRTVTNITLGSDGELIADPGVVTFTNNIVMQTGVPLRFSSSEEAA